MRQSKSRIVWVAAVAFALAAGAAWAESWTNVALVDQNCADKTKADPDSHPRSCAIKCAKGGYGVWTADGKYLKFDAAGSEKALALLNASDRKDHLRVDVTGTLDGEALKVESIDFAKPPA